MPDLLILITRFLNMPAAIYPQKITGYLTKAKTANLKLLDDYSGPILALQRGSPCEAAADMMARCFVGGRSL